MAGKIFYAAVVGASTLLGKELTQEISDSAAAAWDLRLLDESEDAEGQLASAGDEAIVIHKLSEASFEGIDLVFFAGTPDTTLHFGDAAIRSGAAIVDLTGQLAGRPNFALRSPWMESGKRPDLTTVGVGMPLAASLMLAMCMERLQKRFAVSSVVATALEPASEAGSAGVDELHQQTVGLLSFQEVPKQVFGTQVAFNVQGALGDEAKVNLATKREQIRQDLAILLGQEQARKLSVQLLQGPVFHGYVISIFLRLQQAATVDAVRSAVQGGLIVAEPEVAPSNQAAAESGDVLVSVEADAEQEEAFWLVLAADNLRLAARHAVAAALELAALRPAPRVQ